MSDDALHSPTPWRAGSEYSNTQDEIEDADGRTIAVVWTRDSGRRNQEFAPRPCCKDDPKGKANLRLMVEAPSLFAACKSALRALEDNLQPGCMDADAKAALREVIARVKGTP